MKFAFVICSIMEVLIILIVTLATTKNQLIKAENHISFEPNPFSFENNSSKERNEKYRISNSTNKDFLLEKTSKKYENPSTYHKTSTARTYTYPFQEVSNPFENQKSNQLDGRKFFQKSPLRQSMSKMSQEFGYQPDKRGPYFKPFYPMFYHPNHFNDQKKSFYYPQLHKRYGFRNSENNFINRKTSWGKQITDNHDNNPWRIMFYLFERTYKPETVPLNSVSNVDNRTSPVIHLHDSGPALKPYDRESKNRIDDSSNASYQRIDGARLDNLDSQTTPDSDLELLKTKSIFPAKFILSFVNTSKDDAQKGHLPGQDILTNFEKEDLNVTENGFKENGFERSDLNSDLHDESFENPSKDDAQKGPLLRQDILSNFKKEDLNVTENGIKEKRFERSDLNSDLHDETYNFLSSNRIYYKEYFDYSNLSWHVYARCSRSYCQLTNSTNAKELIDQGWILYNCSNNQNWILYMLSCRKMYIETESEGRRRSSVEVYPLMFILITFFASLIVILSEEMCCRKKSTKVELDKQKGPTDEDVPNRFMSSNKAGVKGKPLPHLLASA